MNEQIQDTKSRVFLAGLNTGYSADEFDHSMEELQELAKACDMEVVGIFTQNLQGNGALMDYLDKYRIRKSQYLHHLNQVLLKYQNLGKPVPEEISSQKDLFDR